MATTYQNYISDGSGNPNSRVAFVLSNTLAYTNSTAKAMFTIPDGAYIVQWVVNVITAFNDSGTDLIDVGISGTTQKFVAALDVAATGLKTVNVVAAEIGIVQTPARAVIATYNGQNANASTGALVLMALCFIP
jgi:hypothetical protein